MRRLSSHHPKFRCGCCLQPPPKHGIHDQQDQTASVHGQAETTPSSGGSALSSTPRPDTSQLTPIFHNCSPETGKVYPLQRLDGEDPPPPHPRSPRFLAVGNAAVDAGAYAAGDAGHAGAVWLAMIGSYGWSVREAVHDLPSYLTSTSTCTLGCTSHVRHRDHAHNSFASPHPFRIIGNSSDDAADGGRAGRDDDIRATI